jgi:hypothetical protein
MMVKNHPKSCVLGSGNFWCHKTKIIDSVVSWGQISEAQHCAKMTPQNRVKIIKNHGFWMVPEAFYPSQ